MKALTRNGKLIIADGAFLAAPSMDLQDKTVQPSAEGQTITADSGFEGLSSVVIEGDVNLIPENIAKDTTIFGVVGTHEGGPDISNVTATESDVLAPKIFIDSEGVEKVGTIPTKSAENLTALDASVLVPAGYYPTDVSKNVATIEQVTPIITVSSGGLITASAFQDAGYVVAGTKSATEQLPVQEAQTIMPGVTDKTIEAGKYLTGNQTIKGDANLVPENIAKDAVIFGITGTHQGGEDVSAELTEQDDIIALMQEAIATKSAAGVAEPFAFITVTYPEGSVCTCTNGQETLTAKNTDGTYVFCVPHDGEWTVTSTDLEDNTKTKSQIVEITEEGQFESVELSYGLIVYKNGVFGVNSAGTSFNATVKTDSGATVTKGSEFMMWEAEANSWAKFYITPKTSFFGYKTLYISMENASMTIDTDAAGKGKWGLSSNTTANGNEDLGYVAVANFSKFSGSKTLSVDISALPDISYYIAMQFGTPVGGSFSARVTKIWLE